MIPDAGERFGGLVERCLAGLLRRTETNELSGLLETSVETRQQYLRAVEVHLDLGCGLDREDADAPEEERPMARIALNCSCSWNFFIPGTFSTT